MRLPSSQLPKTQVFTPSCPEEAEEFSKESYIEIGHINVDGPPLLEAPSSEIMLTSVEDYPIENPGPDDTECQGLRVDRLSTVWLMEKLSFVRLGWDKALRILGLVHEAILRMKHGQHHQRNPNSPCPVCQGTLMQESSRRALHTVKAAASRELERSVGKD
jgi:hypothetical protein